MEVERLILKFTSKGSRLAKTIFKKKKKEIEEYILPGVKIYYNDKQMEEN